MPQRVTKDNLVVTENKLIMELTQPFITLTLENLVTVKLYSSPKPIIKTRH